MDWKEALPEIVTQPGSRLRFGESLAKHTHFGIGGEATAYVEISTVSELAALAHFHKKWDVPTAVIGRGSNLLVSDTGFKGIGIRLVGELGEIGGGRERCFGGCGTCAASTVKNNVATWLERCGICVRYPRIRRRCADYECRCMG